MVGVGHLLAALTPIPDDLVYIPLGLVKYSPWKFATATFAGKFIFNEVLVLGAVYFGKPFVDKLISDTSTLFTLIVACGSKHYSLGILIYLSYKIILGQSYRPLVSMDSR